MVLQDISATQYIDNNLSIVVSSHSTGNVVSSLFKGSKQKLWPCLTTPSGRNTPAQLLDVWSGDSDEFGNKSVQCVQLRWKLLEPRGRCLLWFNMWSLRRLAAGRLSHWILWLVVCHLYNHSDWRCASESAQCVGGAEHCVRFVFLYAPFYHSLFSYFGVLARD